MPVFIGAAAIAGALEVSLTAATVIASAVNGAIVGAVVGAVAGGIKAAVTGGDILEGIGVGMGMGAAGGLLTGGIMGAAGSPILSEAGAAELTTLQENEALANAMEATPSTPIDTASSMNQAPELSNAPAPSVPSATGQPQPVPNGSPAAEATGGQAKLTDAAQSQIKSGVDQTKVDNSVTDTPKPSPKELPKDDGKLWGMDKGAIGGSIMQSVGQGAMFMANQKPAATPPDLRSTGTAPGTTLSPGKMETKYNGLADADPTAVYRLMANVGAPAAVTANDPKAPLKAFNTTTSPMIGAQYAAAAN